MYIIVYHFHLYQNYKTNKYLFSSHIYSVKIVLYVFLPLFFLGESLFTGHIITLTFCIAGVVHEVK